MGNIGLIQMVQDTLKRKSDAMYLIDLIFYHTHKINKKYGKDNALMLGFYSVIFFLGINSLSIIITLELLVGKINLNLSEDVGFALLMITLFKKRYKRIIEKLGRKPQTGFLSSNSIFICYVFGSLVFLIFSLISISS